VSGQPRRSGFGLLLLAVGQRSGFTYFGTDKEAYLASLAPLVAFTLVSCGVIALAGQPRRGATLALITLCQVLAPAVIADPLCRRWKREERWALYANILNWAPFLFFMVLAVVVVLVRVAMVLGVPDEAASMVGLFGLLAYAAWFQWSVARGALEISRGQTTVLLGATMLFGVGIVIIQAAFGVELETLTLPTK
jgi:hypothetical protein